jgi:curved DNA-binding protein CbpA
MARYYLHLFNRAGPVRDEEGTDVPDLAAARFQALQAVRDIVSEEAKKGVVDLHGRIEIADELGSTLHVLPFTDAIEVRPPEDMP